MDASYIENAPKPIMLSGSSRTNRPLHTPPRGTTHPRAARALTQPHQNHPRSLSIRTQLNNPYIFIFSYFESNQQLLRLSLPPLDRAAASPIEDSAARAASPTSSPPTCVRASPGEVVGGPPCGGGGAMSAGDSVARGRSKREQS